MGKFERKGLFGRPSRRWECTIKMHFKEKRREDVRVINLVYDRTSDGLL
jgi:hypothetical protein